MSDTSPAIPESIDPANQHKALTAGQQAVIKKLFRRLIVFLFVLFIFSFLDRINIGFAGLTMGRDLGLSATMFGLATTLFYAAYVIFGIPSNIMLSIVGARRWIATIMVLWGIASTATMFATGPTSLYVLRILVGITEAGFLPGILLYLTFWFPAYFRARANALFMVAMPVTTALGSIVSGYILSLDGVMALKGWQWLFLLEGFPSVLLGVMVWFWLDDSPDKAKWLAKEDKKCLQEMMDNDRLTLVQPEGAISHHAMQQRSMWREIFTPVVMMYTLAYFCLTNTLSAISIWTPQILQSFNQGSSNITIGLLAAVPFIVMMGHSSTLWIIYLGFAGFGFARAFFDANTYTVLYDVVPERYHSSASGVMIMTGFAIGALAPVILGAVKEAAGLSSGITMLAGVWLVCGVLMLAGSKRFYMKNYNRINNV